MKIVRVLIIIWLTFSGAAIFSQPVASDTLRWKSNKPISWADFKGKPKKQGVAIRGEAFCMILSDYDRKNPLKKTKYKIAAVWDRAKSWIDDRAKTADELLYYQILFNIYEVHARKFRKELSETKFGIDPEKVFKQKYNEAAAGLMNECNQYRNETESGTDEDAVQEWNEKVKAELKALEQYRE